MDVHRCRFIDYTPGTVSALAFSHRSNLGELTPQNLQLAVGRSDGSIEIWACKNSRNKWLLANTILGGKDRSIEGLVWCSQKDLKTPRLFSIGGSTRISEWDIHRGTSIVDYDCNAGIIWSCAINKSQDRLALGCDDGSVVVVNISGGPGVIEYETILQRQQNKVLSVCWVNDNMIIGGCADGRIRCWSYKEGEHGRLIQTLRVDKSKKEGTLVWNVKVLPHRKQFVSADSTGCIKVWDLTHLTLQQSFTVHQADALCLGTDANETHIFSAGVDRKIFDFAWTKTGKDSWKWVNTTNRLLHGNDIRSMATFQSKNLDLMATGGIERTVLLNAMETFQLSVPLKLSTNLINSNILVNRKKRLIVMWQAQEVKIWRISQHPHSKKLLVRLTLSDEDNISSVALSRNGRYLAVARLSTIKLFELVDVNNGLQVVKVVSTLLQNLGAKMIKFVDSQKLLLMCDADGDVSSVTFNINDDENDEDDISEFDDSQEPVMYEMPETDPYSHMCVSDDGNYAVFSNFGGMIDVIHLTNRHTFRLVHMGEIPTAINFTSSGTLLVATFAHKLYEFNVEEGGEKTNLYTKWSKSNSEFLPSSFNRLGGSCLGTFEAKDHFWVYGTDWIASFDSNQDLPRSNRKGRKRNADGEATGSRNKNSGSKSYWETTKYESLLFVDTLSDTELVLVERPAELMPAPPPFQVSRIGL